LKAEKQKSTQTQIKKQKTEKEKENKTKNKTNKPERQQSVELIYFNITTKKVCAISKKRIKTKYG